MEWVLYSLLAMISFGIMGFLMKFLSTSSPKSVLTYFLISAVFLSVVSIFDKEKVKIDKIYALVAVLLAMGNIFQVKATKLAKNPGIAVMIICLNFVIVIILSSIFLKSPLSLKQIVAVILAIISIILAV